jgi:hypothetical protein
MHGVCVVAAVQMTTEGQYHDLQEVLEACLRHKPLRLAEGVSICWCRLSCYYGQYDRGRDLIEVAARLDRSDVPLYVLRWLVGHEILHKLIPWQGRDFHPATFLAAEQSLPWTARAQAWLAKHRV